MTPPQKLEVFVSQRVSVKIFKGLNLITFLKTQEKVNSKHFQNTPTKTLTLFSNSSFNSREMATLKTQSPHPNKKLNSPTILWESHWDAIHNHSEILTLKFQELLAKFPLNKDNLEFILLAEGPGSFTGLRVAFNFAKTLAYSMEVPVFLTSSFRSHIPAKTLNHPLVVILNAYRNKVFASLYKEDSPEHIIEHLYPKALTPQHLEKQFEGIDGFYVTGEGFNLYKDLWSSNFLQKSKHLKLNIENPATHQLFLMEHPNYSLEFKKSSAFEALPLYIRPSSAEENLNSGQLKKHKRRKP